MRTDELERVMAEADCLHTEADVEAAIERMAGEISAALRHSDPLVYCVMNGGLVFAGRLVLRLNFPLQIGYLHASRYQGATQGGELHWRVPPADSLQGRTVLVVDDILDEGTTLGAIVEACRARGAARVHTAVLVEKRHARRPPGLHSDFIGLQVEDRYVFGFGMDYREYWRNAPGIFAVRGS